MTHVRSLSPGSRGTLAPGARVAIAGSGHVGEHPDRLGRVTEIVGKDGHVARVRWDDGLTTYSAASVLRLVGDGDLCSAGRSSASVGAGEPFVGGARAGS